MTMAMVMNRFVTRLVCAACLAVSLIGCQVVEVVPNGLSGLGSVNVGEFGKTSEGATVELVTLRNANGVEVAISTFGAAIVSIKTPDRQGNSADIVLGFDTLEGYLNNTAYLGVLVGRYANRIAHGRFTLDGTTYSLATNNAPNHLHGGVKGFDKVLWTHEPYRGEHLTARLRYRSTDGEEGYPGNLDVAVEYTLTQENELRITYLATTDKPTVINLSNHSYFNLAGSGDILGHQMQIPADRFTPVSSSLIPTGALEPVEGTPFDFRTPTAIGARINDDHEQIRFGGGYDHNYVLNSPSVSPTQLQLAARVVDPSSGRTLEVRTSEPGVQFYTGNFLDGTVTGKGGRSYGRRTGFCLETQHFPDSPNQASFPSTVLRPGQKFESTTVYAFGVQR